MQSFVKPTSSTVWKRESPLTFTPYLDSMSLWSCISFTCSSVACIMYDAKYAFSNTATVASMKNEPQKSSCDTYYSVRKRSFVVFIFCSNFHLQIESKGVQAHWACCIHGSIMFTAMCGPQVHSNKANWDKYHCLCLLCRNNSSRNESDCTSC